MATASTLALGQASYQLLEELNGGGYEQISQDRRVAVADNVRVSQVSSKTATTTTVRSLSHNSVAGFGLGEDDNTIFNGRSNDNLILQGDFDDLKVSLGAGADTLNILGNVEGVKILMDRQGGPKYSEEYGTFEGDYQDKDFLNIAGDLTASGTQFSSAVDQTRVRSNQVYTGGGNDTVRVSGIVQNTDFHLGSGYDSS